MITTRTVPIKLRAAFLKCITKKADTFDELSKRYSRMFFMKNEALSGYFHYKIASNGARYIYPHDRDKDRKQIRMVSSFENTDVLMSHEAAGIALTGFVLQLMAYELQNEDQDESKKLLLQYEKIYELAKEHKEFATIQSFLI